jgi:hypothetical protein
VQERTLWHLPLIHNDCGSRVGQMIGLAADDVWQLQPLPKQVLTDEDKRGCRTWATTVAASIRPSGASGPAR